LFYNFGVVIGEVVVLHTTKSQLVVAVFLFLSRLNKWAKKSPVSFPMTSFLGDENLSSIKHRDVLTHLMRSIYAVWKLQLQRPPGQYTYNFSHDQETGTNIVFGVDADEDIELTALLEYDDLMPVRKSFK